MSTPVLPASFLYVPGHRPERFDKAVASGAGAVILDLEDAVPPADKDAARRAVAAWASGRDRTVPVWVRVDPLALEADVACVAEARPDGVVLAKADRETLAALDAVLDPAVPVVGLVESAAALRDLDLLAATGRLLTFGLGEVDLLADLRIAREPGTAAVVDALRTRVVVAAAAAGLAAPIAPTSTDVRDLGPLAASTAHLAAIGFRSRTAIHPAQCPVIEAALAPTAAQVEHAREVVRCSREAGGGGAVGPDGRFIDAAVVRGALETLTRAGENPADPDPSQE